MISREIIDRLDQIGGKCPYGSIINRINELYARGEIYITASGLTEWVHDKYGPNKANNIKIIEGFLGSAGLRLQQYGKKYAIPIGGLTEEHLDHLSQYYKPMQIVHTGAIPNGTLGERIRHFREKVLGYKERQEFAKLLGVERRTIGRWERNENYPLTQHLAKLAALGMDMREIAITESPE